MGQGAQHGDQEMPRGITQQQVDQAADAIVGNGERPTVEKVRAKLGTGSPNTVTRMLEVWWQGLAERLHDAQRIPGVPDEVAAAMTSLWVQAVGHAHEHARAQLQKEHEALATAKAEFEASKAEQEARLASAQAERARAAEAVRLAAAQADALERMVAQLESSLKAQSQERRRLLGQLDVSQSSEARLRDEITSLKKQAEKAREVQERHIRTVEDRAHIRVDCARTDLKALRTELAGAQQQHRKDEQALQKQISYLTNAIAEAKREASHQRGIAEALALNAKRRRRSSVPNRPAGKRPATHRSRATKSR